MEENEQDVEYQRGLLTRKMEAGEDVVLQTDRAAVLHNVNCPRAEFHFIVLPKVDIEHVTALKPEHLPLLDHMMELANATIARQHLPSRNFRIGFKMNAFMNRLNMHVISDDFCSPNMRRIHHWNTFNTDLFVTFQAVYALLRTNGCIEPLSADLIDQLRTTTPVHCHQCTFKTGNFEKFKSHLYYHWSRKRCNGVSNLTQAMSRMHMNNQQNMRLSFNQQPGILGCYPHGPSMNIRRFPPNGQELRFRAGVNNIPLQYKHPVNNPFRSSSSSNVNRELHQAQGQPTVNNNKKMSTTPKTQDKAKAAENV